MKRICWVMILIFSVASLSATNYFIAVYGNDSSAGSIDAPFATLNKAQSLVVPGDTVYIRGGVYHIEEKQIMAYKGAYAYVFDLQKSGLSPKKRICYFGYRNERPVFDLSQVKPAGKRVMVFHVAGSFLYFKNFEVVGTQVTLTGHTQSECFRSDGGNNNIYEGLAMHDGMAIGFYLIRGANNLILNCDAYNNYDYVSEDGRGGNVDGFGGHPTTEESVGNVFRGCRAWYNSDDGFDLINARAACTIDHCWSFLNGYIPATMKPAGDGTGFKAGGYGMQETVRCPEVPPVHRVEYCLAYYNRNKGFYANHHLGGIVFSHNTGYRNPSNFCMLNRKPDREIANVDGYGHVITDNLSFAPRSEGKHLIDVDVKKCTIRNNSFYPQEKKVEATDFISLDPQELILPRKADGSLPDINFMKPKSDSDFFKAALGY